MKVKKCIRFKQPFFFILHLYRLPIQNRKQQKNIVSVTCRLQRKTCLFKRQMGNIVVSSRLNFMHQTYTIWLRSKSKWFCIVSSLNRTIQAVDRVFVFTKQWWWRNWFCWRPFYFSRSKSIKMINNAVCFVLTSFCISFSFQIHANKLQINPLKCWFCLCSFNVQSLWLSTKELTIVKIIDSRFNQQHAKYRYVHIGV